MLKHWVLIAGLLTIGIVAGQTNKDSNPHQEPTRQQQPIHTPDRETGQLHAATDQAQSSNVRPGRDAFLKWPKWMRDSNWWLIIIAALTGGVVSWQGWETRKAAQAGKRSADAALAQVNLVKYKERARLIVQFPPRGPSTGLTLIRVDIDKEYETLSLDVEIAIVNEGATAAFSIQATGGFTAAPENTNFDVLKGYRLNVPTVVGAGNSSNSITARIEPKIDISSIEACDWKAILNGSKVLHVFGTVSYDDVFDDKWHTPFHFVWVVHRYGSDEEDREPEWKNISPAGNRDNQDQRSQKGHGFQPC